MIPFKLDKNHLKKTDPYVIACGKVMGKYNKRRRSSRPASIMNVSAMSFCSLSARAVEHKPAIIPPALPALLHKTNGYRQELMLNIKRVV